jgi:signal peptidase I
MPPEDLHESATTHATSPAPRSKPVKRESWFEVVKTIVYALLIAGVIRSFIFQPFNIPSGSMEATLLVGDYLFVSKSAYGFSRYSLPWGIIPFSGRVLPFQPTRGDVVVFKFPGDNSTDYIKRLIGLPGDRIQMKNSVLYINDKPVPRVRVQDYIEYFGPQDHHVTQFRETLPNGVSYNTLQRDPEGDLNNTQVFVVPEGHYFMMGDNRDNSTDSRVLSAVGYVPFENIVGRAQMIFFSIAEGEHAWMFWRWPTAVRWNRIFSIVR